MKFLEKNLEAIIWENHASCWERGLDIREFGDIPGMHMTYRQLFLGPYGIADLVNIEVCHKQREVYIEVIECKREIVNLDTYTQAKRYVTGIKALIKAGLGLTDEDWQFTCTTVLIGKRIDKKDGLLFVYNEDPLCKVYTYNYGVDGIAFELVPKFWRFTTLMPLNAEVKFIEPWREMLGSFYKAMGDYRQLYAEPTYAAWTPFAGVQQINRANPTSLQPTT